MIRASVEDVRVDFLLENVFTMQDQSRDTISEIMVVEPYALDAKDFLPCRRLRYFWCSWKLLETIHCKLMKREGYVEVKVQAHHFPSTVCLGAGSEWPESNDKFVYGNTVL